MTNNTPLTISPAQARKIVLLSQGIHKHQALGQTKNAVLKAIEQIGYVQIDTISVVQRAHHHSLWNRVSYYQLDHIDQLLADKQIFEYWSHAAAYLPMRDFRFSLPRKQAVASGDIHWFEKDLNLTKQIIARITAEGPLQARDFEQPKQAQSGWWDWKPAKKALEQLFIEGELMVVKRQGFQKVYDLTERVLPAGIDTSTPDTAQYCKHLIVRYLSANGIGTLSEMSYLLKGIKPALKQQCDDMLENGELITVNYKEQSYYARPQVMDLLSQSLSRSKVKILSPFDNLLIQRKRTKALFNFDYQIECYVPAAKRQFGYFCLPLLWGQNFAGRMDAKIDRKTGVLHIQHLHLETPKVEAFLAALKPSLDEFMVFNQASLLNIHAITSHQAIANQTRLEQLLLAI